MQTTILNEASSHRIVPSVDACTVYNYIRLHPRTREQCAWLLQNSYGRSIQESHIL